MSKTMTIVILLFLSLVGHTQGNPAAAEAQTFIPKGYESLDYIPGDLNGDKKPDAILVLKQPGEDTAMRDELSRSFIVLLRQNDGKLKQVLRNDSVILCRQCGGVFGDPYAGIQIKNSGFTLSFYGGSSWRWGNDYQFVYRPAKKNWFLLKETDISFHAGDPEHTTKKAVLEESELGERSLSGFNCSPVYEDSHWKVKATKTFFYNSPKLGSQPRKGFLVKGNEVTGIRQLKNFVEVSFEDSKGNFTEGYILKKDLQKL